MYVCIPICPVHCTYLYIFLCVTICIHIKPNMRQHSDVFKFNSLPHGSFSSCNFCNFFILRKLFLLMQLLLDLLRVFKRIYQHLDKFLINYLKISFRTLKLMVLT